MALTPIQWPPVISNISASVPGKVVTWTKKEAQLTAKEYNAVFEWVMGLSDSPSVMVAQYYCFRN